MLEQLPGNAGIRDRMSLAATRSEDIAPAFTAIVQAFRLLEDRRFGSNGAWPPGSQSWAPLAENTIKKKQRLGQPTDRILFATGDLLGSLIGTGNGGAASGGSVRMSSEMLEVVTAVVDERGRGYAQYHQLGTEHMPQRKVVDITEEVAAVFALILSSHLVGHAHIPLL